MTQVAQDPQQEKYDFPFPFPLPFPFPGVDPGFSEGGGGGGGGGLTTARGNGVCPLPHKAEKLLPLLFVTKNY